MGRFNRKRYLSVTSSGSGDEDEDVSKAWTSAERKEVLEYLLEYRDQAVGVYYQSKSKYMMRNKKEVKARKIGSIEFPALTQKELSRPYLALPKALRAKQRRLIHECCTEADLYHCGVGRTKEQRYLVISIYTDGFNGIGELQFRPNLYPLHKFRPWVCRRERQTIQSNSLSSSSSSPNTSPRNAQTPEEARAREKIEALIDQPGDSIRDGQDILFIDQLENKSLAQIPPPRYGEDESWVLVDSVAKMKECIAELTAGKPSLIAFDLEAYNRSKYAQMTCLLQLATDVTREYLIDTLAPGVWEEVRALAPFFEDPSIVKVAHSIGGLDVVSLHRDFGIFVVNCFDTYEASKVLKLPSHGLASVCEYYGLSDIATFKSLKECYQTCDWTVRPLTHPMMHYGRYDVHYLLPLRELMMRDLTRDAWGGPDPESHLVAEALMQTLKQFAREDEYGSDEPDGQSDNEGAGEEDDNKSFQTSKEDRDYDGDESFFTAPSRSRSFDELQVTQERRTSGVSVDGEPLSELDAPLLRMQPQLMKTVSFSQERCLRVWKPRSEPPMQNALFASLLHRAMRKEVTWTVAQTQLYNNLVEWRDRVAIEMECLPHFVAPLDFIVALALKRPVTDADIRRINYFLPPLLEESEAHREQVYALIQASLAVEPAEPRETLLYSNFGSTSEEYNRDLGGRSQLLWRVCIVSAVVAGVAIAVIAAKKRKR